MELKNISDLIQIRNYVMSAINNYNLPRDTVTTLNNMLILMDKKITDQLMSSEFKEFINYSDAKKAVARAAEINNIKTGMSPSNSMVTMNAGKANIIK